MGLLSFRRKTAAPSNVEFQMFDGNREPVFTDTVGGKWRVKPDGGSNFLHPLGEHAYQPEFEPALPESMQGIKPIPHVPAAPDQPRTTPTPIGEYFGGFPLSDINDAVNIARRGSPVDAYHSTADTPLLQQEARPYYCTTSESDNVLSQIGKLESEHEEYATGKRSLEKPRTLTDDSDMRIPLTHLENAISHLKSLHGRRRVVTDNPTFNNTALVQPGHIVTLRGTSPEGSEADTTYYLLSHPSESIEREHPGAQHLFPHSFLGKELLLRSRGDEIKAPQISSSDGEDRAAPWGEYGRDQAIYKFEQTTKRKVTPEERASFMARPMELINHGKIVDIKTPSAVALSGSGPETFNSGS